MQIEQKLRTKNFSIAIINLVENLPNTVACRIISNQIIKSATSVGANYRAVCRARSDKEFISKMNIVLEEADEVGYWLEIIEAKNWIDAELIKINLVEANELTAMFSAALKTMNNRLKK